MAVSGPAPADNASRIGLALALTSIGIASARQTEHNNVGFVRPDNIGNPKIGYSLSLAGVSCRTNIWLLLITKNILVDEYVTNDNP